MISTDRAHDRRERRRDRLDDLQQSGAAQRGVARHVAGDARRSSTISSAIRRSASSCCSGAGDKAFVSGADISQFEQQRASTEAASRNTTRSPTARGRLQELPQADHRDDPWLLHRRRARRRAALRPAHRRRRCALRHPGGASSASAIAGAASRSWSISSARPMPRRSSSPRAISPRRKRSGMGLINRVVPEGELEAFVAELLRA